MADESVHNNPQYPTEDRFEQLKVQVSNISRHMNLLMVALARKCETFEDDGGYNSKIKS
jgi:hypothetical protein